MSCFDYSASGYVEAKLMTVLASCIKNNLVATFMRLIDEQKALGRHVCDIVNAPLKLPGNPTLFGPDNTLLHIACFYLRPEFIRILLDFGANVNAENGHGATPLWMCFGFENPSLPAMSVTQRFKPQESAQDVAVNVFPQPLDTNEQVNLANSHLLEKMQECLDKVGSKRFLRPCMTMLLGESDLTNLGKTLPRYMRNPCGDVREHPTDRISLAALLLKNGYPSELQMIVSKTNFARQIIPSGGVAMACVLRALHACAPPEEVCDEPREKTHARRVRETNLSETLNLITVILKIHPCVASKPVCFGIRDTGKCPVSVKADLVSACCAGNNPVGDYLNNCHSNAGYIPHEVIAAACRINANGSGHTQGCAEPWGNVAEMESLEATVLAFFRWMLQNCTPKCLFKQVDDTSKSVLHLVAKNMPWMSDLIAWLLSVGVRGDLKDLCDYSPLGHVFLSPALRDAFTFHSFHKQGESDGNEDILEEESVRILGRCIASTFLMACRLDDTLMLPNHICCAWDIFKCQGAPELLTEPLFNPEVLSAIVEERRKLAGIEKPCPPTPETKEDTAAKSDWLSLFFTLYAKSLMYKHAKTSLTGICFKSDPFGGYCADLETICCPPKHHQETMDV